jgi:hypothetical protein
VAWAELGRDPRAGPTTIPRSKGRRVFIFPFSPGSGDGLGRVRSDVFESVLVEAEVVAEFMKHREADFFADGVFDRTP